jgi:hypothetical protein
MRIAMRALLAGIAAALWMALVDATFDHEWPSRSVTGWLVYVGGFPVIYGGVMAFDSILASKRRRAAPSGYGSPATGTVGETR